MDMELMNSLILLHLNLIIIIKIIVINQNRYSHCFKQFLGQNSMTRLMKIYWKSKRNLFKVLNILRFLCTTKKEKTKHEKKSIKHIQ